MTFNGWKEVVLEEVSYYGDEKIPSAEVTLDNYISTENMLPNKSGVGMASGLPTTKSVRRYKKGDILLSNIRPYFKKIWFATKNGGCSNDVLVIKNKDEKELDKKYLYYTLLQDNFFDYVTATSKGTKMPRGDKSAIMNYGIMLPPLNEQKAIANILSTLDEKIETNNQINEKLEEMAQALFKHWFVDFEFPNENGDPYKSSGGEMVESELGMIPKGWEICQLDDLVDIIDNRGKTPPLSQNKTNYPIIDVKALTGTDRIVNYDNCSKFVDKNTYETWFRSGHPKTGDILLSTVGSIGELKLFFGDKGCIAQNVVALRTKNISYLYLFQYMRHIKKQLISYNIGSVQPSIKITHVKKHKILVPKKDIEDSFTEIIKNISFLIFNNSIENQRLVSIRDNLLPKLMSGEIRIPMEDGVLSEKN
ncbi:restriction endonuclease subunit S [Caldifermentibacillus hisashii]|uniref:restriction endonuclease subunit S n=1 Tax=Caldifermentibacillus hisashii TaxID=996558 RepID=UPI0031B7290C